MQFHFTLIGSFWITLQRCIRISSISDWLVIRGVILTFYGHRSSGRQQVRCWTPRAENSKDNRWVIQGFRSQVFFGPFQIHPNSVEKINQKKVVSKLLNLGSLGSYELVRNAQFIPFLTLFPAHLRSKKFVAPFQLFNPNLFLSFNSSNSYNSYYIEQSLEVFALTSPHFPQNRIHDALVACCYPFHLFILYKKFVQLVLIIITVINHIPLNGPGRFFGSLCFNIFLKT